MQFGNAPEMSFLPQIHPDVFWYYVASMFLFTVFFYLSLNIWLAMRRDGFPPDWVLSLRRMIGLDR